MEFISHYHNNPLTSYFGIKKTCKLLAEKYYWPTFCLNIKAYVKRCDVYLALKAVRHKPYDNLQSLPVLTHQWKDRLIDFVTSLPISTDWKRNSYNVILVIVNWLTKLVYYKPVKINIDTIDLAEVIINMVVWHHGLLNLIVTDKEPLFTLKFWSLLSYFLDIKRKLSTVFHP